MTEQDLPLPELLTETLSADTLRDLVTDLQQLAQQLEVRVKQGATQKVNSDSWDLQPAVEALVAGELLGVQLTYDYRAQTFRDTLMATPAGVKLVRMVVGPQVR